MSASLLGAPPPEVLIPCTGTPRWSELDLHTDLERMAALLVQRLCERQVSMGCVMSMGWKSSKEMHSVLAAFHQHMGPSQGGPAVVSGCCKTCPLLDAFDLEIRREACASWHKASTASADGFITHIQQQPN